MLRTWIIPSADRTKKKIHWDEEFSKATGEEKEKS
jgi:hypothetical protein